MILIVGAYGRKYQSLDEAKADWEAGKDFRIVRGPYCSIRDTELFKSMGHAVVLKDGINFELSEIVIKGN